MASTRRAYAINSFEFPHRNSFGSLYFMATDENDDLTTSKGYFLAGRGLSGIVIGCSMVLTSLSTEQLIGVNAVSYQNNFSIIAWTVPTVIPLCFLALYMLPKYLRNGYTTIPEFFENRFDRQTRLIMSGVILSLLSF